MVKKIATTLGLLCGIWVVSGAAAADPCDSAGAANTDDFAAPAVSSKLLVALDQNSYEAPEVVGKKGKDMDYLDCESGSLELIRALRTEPQPKLKGKAKAKAKVMDGEDPYLCHRPHEPGVLIQHSFQRDAFPSLNACVRELAGVGADEPARIQVMHDGIFNDRESLDSKWSLHAVGRAMDIVKIRVGEREYDYRSARNNIKGKQWREFWAPLVTCLESRKLAALWEDGPHRTHLHFSLPYARGARLPRANMHRM
jgi:hypothetical protein